MPKPIHRGEYEAIRTLLRQLRLDAGLKQSELSEALGKPQPYISAIETGHRRVDIIEIRDICSVLKLTLTYFVERLEESIRTPSKNHSSKRTRVS